MPKKNKKRKNEQKRLRIEKKARTAVIHYLRSKGERSFNHKQIAAGADLRGLISHTKLVEVLEELAENGKIKRVGRGKYAYIFSKRVLEATLDMARDGFGFAILEDEGMDDIFIGPRNIGKAFNGDKVKVRLLRSGSRGHRKEGEVIEIVERARDTFIGLIEDIDGTLFFMPDDPKNNHEFLIAPEKKLEAKDGDKVLVKLLNWEFSSPVGEVVRVLGEEGDNETEMHAILFQYGFEPEFPESVEAEAASINGTISNAEIKKRRDFRQVTTFTIDPPDAKDFDDALSFEKLDNGHFEIGVHIADVSHYVKPGTEMDKEGFHRATSVYLVDRTVPMLPERLSNGLCSLVPNEDRLAFSAVFEIDAEGKIYQEWFGRTVIHSDRRFAY
ncbi:MAG: RNB domain-containing ribonuclease, partial [Bacteroidota bacterium]